MNIFESAKEHVLVVAHRGACGGNIPCNTLAAYEIALKQGADMIEIDVDKTSDDKLIIFHPGMEHAHLNKKINLREMTYDEVKQVRFVNFDNTTTQFGINTFDDILETFKNRCYINVDKFWDNPEAIYHQIKRHNMLDQIVVKSSPSDKVFTVLKEVAPDVAFMPIVSRTHEKHGEFMESGINYVGAEVLFTSDNDEVASPEFIDMMHRDGKLVWVNSIIYDYKAQLCAGHSDDTSLTSTMDEGWGWLADRGFDLIQTDWALMLIEYLKSVGKYTRN